MRPAVFASIVADPNVAFRRFADAYGHGIFRSNVAVTVSTATGLP
jgi:hypothetical protein